MQSLIARYSAVQTVARARGNAARARQRGVGNAYKLAATVDAEVRAFSNVTATVGVSPREVLDFAYWQLLVHEDAAKARRLPLHDLLLARPGGHSN